MKVTKEELEKEKKYLSKTLEVIKSLINEDEDSVQNRITEINEMKRYIWENNTELDDMEIASGMYDVNVNVSSTNKKIKYLQQLKKSLNSPYFGRIDFNSEEEIQKIYIGINGVSKDLHTYIYDWRTPIASLFYNYGIGPASYDSPLGKTDGTVELKRQYKIQGEHIERCFDSDLNIEDEYLQEVLSSSSSEKMVNIVNTIQKEQNEIIRNIIDKYLIVQGIAGSGKTSVALHRIAYLLYKEKDLTSKNVLIFSPNEVFSEYISNVLPDLGEDNVLETTFSDFSKTYIKDVKEIENFTSFVERYYKQKDVDEEYEKSTKYKLSNEFKKFLDCYISKLKHSLSFKAGIKINGRLTSKEELNQLLKRSNSFSIDHQLDFVTEYICNSYHIPLKQYEKMIKMNLKKLLNLDLDVWHIYEKIVTSNEFKKRAGLKQNEMFIKEKKLKYEDLLPILYLTFELNEYPYGNKIKHVIIDEAQDYTLLQLTMLKKIFKKASFTILGDINQTINPYYQYHNLNEINSIFDNQGKYIELLKTYRSSEEIIEFTNEILGIHNVCSVRKNNSIPVSVKEIQEEEVRQQLLEAIGQMRKNAIKRVAIITKSYTEAIELYELLKEEIKEISLVEERKKMANIVILPSYISKGLEFDGVIAYMKEDNLYEEKDKYLFYVVCTRAQHSLTILNQKNMTLERKRI